MNNIQVYVPPPVSNNPNSINYKNNEINTYQYNNKGGIISCTQNPVVNWDIYYNRPQYRNYLILGPKYCHHTIEKVFNNNTRRSTFNCNPN